MGTLTYSENLELEVSQTIPRFGSITSQILHFTGIESFTLHRLAIPHPVKAILKSVQLHL